jgi:hypothetical protein
MTELMKRYEADFEKGLTRECYQSWLEIEISDNKRYIATLESKIRMYKYEIKQLKSQLTWHDATKEKPEERLLVIVRAKSKFYEPHFNRDFWIVTISNVQNGVWEGIDQGYEVMEWLNIPPAPEGEVK